MQDEVISWTQLTGICDSLVCILNTRVLRYAPRFVTNDSVTVATG
jgi:hypothetical protein